MLFALPHRSILVTGAALLVCAGFSGCGQKGPLYLPQTPASVGRATLPQTILGGGTAKAAAPAAVASNPLPATPPSVLPNVPDIQ